MEIKEKWQNDVYLRQNGSKMWPFVVVVFIIQAFLQTQLGSLA